MRKWFRNFVHAKQLMNPEYAARAKNRLALLYAFGAWNLLGILIAITYKEKVPKVHDSVDYAKVLGIKNATVMKFSNLTKVDEYNIDLSNEEIEDFSKVIGVKEEIQKYEEKNEERIKAIKAKENIDYYR